MHRMLTNHRMLAENALGNEDMVGRYYPVKYRPIFSFWATGTRSHLTSLVDLALSRLPFGSCTNYTISSHHWELSRNLYHACVSRVQKTFHTRWLSAGRIRNEALARQGAFLGTMWRQPWQQRAPDSPSVQAAPSLVAVSSDRIFRGRLRARQFAQQNRTSSSGEGRGIL